MPVRPVVAVAPAVIEPPVPLAVSAERVSPPAPAQAAPEQTHAGVLQPRPTPTATPERQLRAPAERERVHRAGPRNASPPAATSLRDAARPTEPAVATPVAAAPAATPAPSPAQTVDQSCADSSNFLSRDFCRVRACRNPAMAGDPVCVRFREMEAASRRRMDQ